jgi:hypothetical protein
MSNFQITSSDETFANISISLLSDGLWTWTTV